MKRLVILVAFLVVLILTIGFLFAQDSTSRAVSYEALVISTTAVPITPARLSLVSVHGMCSGRLEGADIRFRLDGTNPTSAEGQLLKENELITIRGLTNLLAIRFIRDAGVNGTLRLTCYQ